MYKNKTNIEIVKSYLDGERLFPVFGYVPKKIKRKPGEEWIDTKGIKWKQERGYKKRVNDTADIIREALSQKCNICNSDIKWGTKVDQKFYNRTGFCEKCLIDYETKLRIVGIYPEYERYKLLSYELGYIKEVKEKIEEVIKFFTESSGDVEMICNSEGFIERWKNTNSEDILSGAKNDLKLALKRIAEITSVMEKEKKKFQKGALKFKLKSYV